MNLEDVQHLLPESAQLLVDLIGLHRTLKLVDAFGGTTFPVALKKTRLGEARYDMLAEVLGVDAANILTNHFGGDLLYIPLCKNALRELFYRQLRAEFDQMTKENSAIQAVVTLANRYRMSDRHIWRILKKQNNEGYTAHQATLF